MDPITIMLTTALTAGAAGIAAGALQEIGRETYVGLKTKVVERFRGKANIEPALTMLEGDPDSEAIQTMLKETLDKGVQADPEAESDAALREAAQKLLALLAENELPTTEAVKITLIGDGAIAQGKGAVSAGKGGIAIGGSVGNSTIGGEEDPK